MDAPRDQAEPRAQGQTQQHHQHSHHKHQAADEGRRHNFQQGEDWGGSGYNHHSQQHGRHNSGNSWDDDHRRQQQRDRWNDENNGGSWRWNENGSGSHNQQDSATRRDLMPGHVHVLGILRHSRSRRLPLEERHHDPDDDCLGSDAPLLNPTGDPLLDARLEREQAELASRWVSTGSWVLGSVYRDWEVRARLIVHRAGYQKNYFMMQRQSRLASPLQTETIAKHFREKKKTDFFL
jgi:hypothetical protein